MRGYKQPKLPSEGFAVDMKKKRLKTIINTLKSARLGNKEVSYDRFIAEFEIQLGVTGRKMREYLDLLERAKQISIKEVESLVDQGRKIRVIEYVGITA